MPGEIADSHASLVAADAPALHACSGHPTPRSSARPVNGVVPRGPLGGLTADPIRVTEIYHTITKVGFMQVKRCGPPGDRTPNPRNQHRSMSVFMVGAQCRS